MNTSLSVRFSHSVMSDSLQRHGLPAARNPYPSPTPGVYSNSWPLSGNDINHLKLCHPLCLPPSILPRIRVFFFFSFIFTSWRLITLQYCSGFCHILTWISHGFTCIPYPDPPSHLPLYQILFQWVSSSHQVAKVLEFQLHHQFFKWIFRTDFF